MSSREDLRQRALSHFGLLVKRYEFTDVITDSPKEIQDRLDISAQDFRSMIQQTEKMKLVFKIEHPTKKTYAYFINLEEHEGNEIIDTGLRFCAIVDSNDKLKKVRHGSHSEEITCSRLDPAVWNLDSVYAARQTQTTFINSNPAELLSEPLNSNPEHKEESDRSNRILYSRTMQFKDGTSRVFYVTPSGYLTQDGKHKFNTIQEIEDFWFTNWRKKLSRYDQQYGYGRKRIELWSAEANEKQKFWMDEATKIIYDEYGDPLGIYPNRKEIVANFFKAIWKELIAQPYKNQVERMRKANEEVAEENRRCREIAKYRDEMKKKRSKEYAAELRVENKIRSYQKM